PLGRIRRTTGYAGGFLFFVQILYTNIRNRNRNPEVVNHKTQSARLLTTSVVCYQKNAAIGKTEIKNQILNGG
ncbi:MAG: hypothetical protein ACLUAK_08930, partial [Dialister invisus]|uniref:hypothetical protein n=1 Tax=Dialister invisus TaxID=218538 RepID=UPI003993D64F